MPDIIQRLKDAYIQNPASALALLPELFKQYDEGLIKVLPCKVGTTVFKICSLVNGNIIIVKGKIIDYSISNSISGEEFYFSEESRFHDIWCEFGCFGKTVFLTRGAAEKALEENEKK